MRRTDQPFGKTSKQAEELTARRAFETIEIIPTQRGPYMEAEILLVVGRQRIPGEITTEVQNGTAFFVPWYSVGTYKSRRPYGLHELPRGSRVVIADQQQLHKVAATVIGYGLRPELSKDGETKRYMVRMAVEDRQAIEVLLKRDGQSFSSWARSVLRRELVRRRDY